MSSKGKLIGVCAKGERFWWPANSERDKCPDPDCGCEPTFYRPASEVDRLRSAIEQHRATRYGDALGPIRRAGDPWDDKLYAALHPDEEGS